MKEEWRAAVGYEGLYEVSNLGRVRSLISAIIMKPNKKSDGHLTVSLTNSGKGKEKRVHRLVLEAFVGPCPEGHECCHFPDRNPANNRVENIMWGTRKENHGHMKIHGTEIVGERHHAAKLTAFKVRLARRLHATGEWTYKEIAEAFGADIKTMKGAITGQNWKHVK